AMVLYDSKYGNTQKIAATIAQVLGDGGVAELVSHADMAQVLEQDLLIVASPTQGGRPTPAISAFVKGIPAAGLTGHDFSVCDTRISAAPRGLPLRLLMRLIGYAAPKLAAI